MTSPSPEAVAAGLTEAQKTFLLSLPLDGWKHWPNGMTDRERAGLRGFGKSGLVYSRYEHSGVYHRLTDLGLLVRQAILEEG